MRALTRMLLLAAACAARDYQPYMFAAVPLHAPVPVLRVLAPAPPAPPAPRPPRRPGLVQLTPYTRPYPDLTYPERAYPDLTYPERGSYAESRPFADVRPYSESNEYVESRQYPEPRQYPEQRQYPESRQYPEPRQYPELRQYPEPRPRAPFPEARPYGDARPRAGPRPYLEAVEYYDEAARPAAASSELLVEWGGLALPAGAREEPPPAPADPAVLYARPAPAGGYTYRPLSPKPPKKVPSSKEQQPVLIKIHKHRIIKS